MIALEALLRFIRAQRRHLDGETFPALTGRYRIPVDSDEAKTTVSITVNTMPELAAELEEMAGFEAEDDTEELNGMAMFRSLRDDLIPEDSFLSLGVLSWEMVESLQDGVEYYQECDLTKGGDGLPVILIQTSRPKAKTVIKKLQEAGGLKGICFNPGADPMRVSAMTSVSCKQKMEICSCLASLWTMTRFMSLPGKSGTSGAKTLRATVA